MKRTILFLMTLCCLMGCTAAEKSPKAMQQVDFSRVLVKDAFWTPRLENNAKNTIPVCIDQIENQTGRMRNFEKAAIRQGPHSGIFFDDSDVYKAVEGMAYSLINNPDPALEAKADEWIDKFAAAQQEDGYINTFFTIEQPQRRWVDMDKHEMYCAGHLLEAGVAYYKATGKRKLLDVAQKMVDYMMTVFGPDKRDWVPGHEEIELALVKLYEVTLDRKYLDFAHWLLEERGRGIGTFDVNLGKERQWDVLQYQDAFPVSELTQISGHAVRAMYLFCGMCDVTSYNPETGYMEALDRLWDDVTLTRMYITGGIGVAYRTEGFAAPFELPNYEAYCETCASIGMVLWNHRMNEWKGDAKYADIVERSLFNGVLAGISLGGDRFFYVNPLASHGNHHRQAWYGCACCPSNVCRFIPSIGNYIYGTSENAIWVNLYIGSEASFKVGRKDVSLSLETLYPWNGSAALTFSSSFKGEVRLRVPGWCKSFTISINGSKTEDFSLDRGYAVIEGKWSKGECISIDMDMPVTLVAADPRVKADEGMRAVQRGPLVYCIEQTDNDIDFENVSLGANTTFETSFEKDLLGGVQTIFAKTGGSILKYIPYYSWDNREAGQMKVWLPYDTEHENF